MPDVVQNQPSAGFEHAPDHIHNMNPKWAAWPGMCRTMASRQASTQPDVTGRDAVMSALPHSHGEGLIMELPLYHRPNIKTILRAVWTRLTLFVRRVSGLIMAAVILVWAAGYFPDGSLETSYMYRFGQWLEPFAGLMGMDWRFMVALLTSFVAKETTAGTLAVLFSLGSADGQAVSTAIAGAISPAGALAFVVASHLYIPCLATIAMLRSETGSWRWTGVQMALMFTLAFAMALATYQAARLLL